MFGNANTAMLGTTWMPFSFARRSRTHQSPRVLIPRVSPPPLGIVGGVFVDASDPVAFGKGDRDKGKIDPRAPSRVKIIDCPLCCPDRVSFSLPLFPIPGFSPLK